MLLVCTSYCYLICTQKCKMSSGFFTSVPFTVRLLGDSTVTYQSSGNNSFTDPNLQVLGRPLTVAQEQEFSQALGKDFIPFKRHQ